MTTDYENAVSEFNKSDAEFQLVKKFVESGEFLQEVFDRSQGNPVVAKEVWGQIWDKLRELNSERNSRLKVAKDYMRRAVQFSQSSNRGPGGQATILKSDNFVVSSVTHRSLNAKVVLDMCESAGLGEQLKGLTYTDKNGMQKPSLEVEYSLEYESGLKWLQAMSLDSVVASAYEETEKTPAVRGPKETSMLGEQKKE